MVWNIPVGDRNEKTCTEIHALQGMPDACQVQGRWALRNEGQEMKPRHNAWPRYSNSDGSRNYLGDALLRWLPFFALQRTASGPWTFFLCTTEVAGGEAVARSYWALFGRTMWGVRIGRVLIQSKPWAFTAQYFRFGNWHVGAA